MVEKIMVMKRTKLLKEEAILVYGVRILWCDRLKDSKSMSGEEWIADYVRVNGGRIWEFI